MKKNIFLSFLIISMFFCITNEQAYGQNNSPIDLILILDTSTAMTSSYENVSNYLTGPFLKEYLRVGDTFHLISFSSSVRLELARRINGIGDVETIIGRILIQYPVETGSNPGSAISFTEQYISNLPTRSKKIVLVSTENQTTNNLVSSANQRLSSKNASIDYVQVTPGRTVSTIKVVETITEPDTQTPEPATAPAPAQTSTPTTPPPVSRTQPPAAVPGTQLTESNETEHKTEEDLMEHDPETSSLDEDLSETEKPSDSQNRFVVPVDSEEKKSESSFTFSLPLIIGIIILVLLLLGLIFFLITRRLSSSPNRVMSKVASSGSKGEFEDHSKDLASYAAGQSRQRTTPYDNRPANQDKSKPMAINPAGPLLLNLFVKDQSKSIGRRNIHSLKSGYSLSIGGGPQDDFLIFLVPMPSGIGEIKRNGSQLTFVPKKPKYFPDIKGEVKDCIGKTITIVSDKNYEMRFMFEMYEDPLVSLNRLLHSLKVPG